MVYEKEGVQTIVPLKTSFSHRASTSKYAPHNRYSETFFVSTDADFVAAEVPIEALGHIGIDGSFARLTDGVLY